MDKGGLMRKKKVEETPVEVVEEVVEVKDVPEFYILKIGETLKQVANKFGLKEEDLKNLNGEVVGTNQIRLK